MSELPRLPPRYEARSLLGEGATGSVWLALDLETQELVAIKVVRANLALHARFRARFAREVALSARVSHPNVVPVHAFGTLEDGRPYVVLAYAEQGSFEDLLRQALPLHQALIVLDQVLAALGYLHARALLHQDLKPANVLLTQRSTGELHAWVADLGVAGDRTELALDRRGIAGTPTWMAPEQLLGRAQEMGPWTDLYAVGLMLHQMLGGPGAQVQQAMPALLEERLRPLPLQPGVPGSLREIVAQLLDPDPKQRFDRAADVQKALRDASRGLGPGLYAKVVNAIGHGTTTFPDTILPEAMEPIAVLGPARPEEEGVPRWNRVPPDPMPELPPQRYTRTRRQRASAEVVSLRAPELVGRDLVRRRIWSLARKVVATGEPQVALIIGEFGSGKSRLAQAMSQDLQQGGWAETVTLRYHFPAGVEDGYRGAVREILSPWRDTRFELARRLQGWLARDQRIPPERAAAEAKVLARWCGYVGDHEQPVNAAVGLAFLYRHLDVRAWRGAAVLVLDDVHHAQAQGDGLSICEALLERSVGERPLLVLATLSSEVVARNPALSEKLATLQRMGAVKISAPRLGDAQMRALLEGTLGFEHELARAVAPACDGSPGYAVLLLRAWAVGGQVVSGPAGFRLRPGLPLEQALPASLDDLCEWRVSGVLERAEQAEAVSEALAATALAGQEPPVPVVRAVNQEGLDALLASGLVEQRGWRLVFEHAGVQRVARRRALGRSDVADLHRKLADAWASMGHHTGMDVNLPLGLHRLHGAEADRAVMPLLQAARTALSEGRPTLALDSGRLAVVAADRAGVAMARVEARQRMAEALLDLDRPAEARKVLQESREGVHLDRRSKARLDVLAARAAIAVGELDLGRSLLGRAATGFEATRDWPGLVDTAHGQGALYRLEGRPEEAADRFARMLRINRGKDPRLEVLGLVGLIEARIAAGRLNGLGRHLDRLREVARESGDTRNIAQATYVGGLLHLRRRHLETADRHFQTARALAATLGADRLYLACTNNLGEVARYKGELTAARRFYDQAVRFADQRQWQASSAVARLNLGLLALHADEEKVARRHIEQVAGLLKDHPRHWAWLFVGLLRALWAARIGDMPSCRGWWAVARERGLGRVRSPDLWLPLERLAAATQDRGWHEISRQAAMLAQHADTSEVDLLVEE